MREISITLIVGLVLGTILSLANLYSPMLLPWAVGFMLACLAVNLALTRKDIP